MKVVVCGGGSLGLAYSGLLSKIVDTTLLVRREEQAKAIKKRGVQVVLDGKKQKYKIDSEYRPEVALSKVDLAIAVVKYPHTEGLISSLSPHLKDSTVFLSLQTGPRPLEDYRVAFSGVPVAGGVSYLGATRLDDSTVEIGSNFRTVVGLDGIDSKVSTRLGDLLTELSTGDHLYFDTSDDIKSVIWEKMVVACSQNAISGLTGSTFGTLRSHEALHPIIAELLKEVRAAAATDGVHLDESQLKRVLDNWASLPQHKASLYRDLDAGLLTEVEALNGTVAHLGRIHGFATPINSLLNEMVHLAENS